MFMIVLQHTDYDSPADATTLCPDFRKQNHFTSLLNKNERQPQQTCIFTAIICDFLVIYLNFPL